MNEENCTPGVPRLVAIYPFLLTISGMTLAFEDAAGATDDAVLSIIRFAFAAALAFLTVQVWRNAVSKTSRRRTVWGLNEFLIVGGDRLRSLAITLAPMAVVLVLAVRFGAISQSSSLESRTDNRAVANEFLSQFSTAAPEGMVSADESNRMVEAYSLACELVSVSKLDECSSVSQFFRSSEDEFDYQEFADLSVGVRVRSVGTATRTNNGVCFSTREYRENVVLSGDERYFDVVEESVQLLADNVEFICRRFSRSEEITGGIFVTAFDLLIGYDGTVYYDPEPKYVVMQASR